MIINSEAKFINFNTSFSLVEIILLKPMLTIIIKKQNEQAIKQCCFPQ